MKLLQKISDFAGFLVLAAPLIVYSSVHFPYTIPRWTWLVGAIAIFSVATFGLKIRETKISVSRLDGAFAIFSVFLCLSVFVTTDLRQTLWSSAARTTGLMLYIVWFAWYAFVRLRNYSLLEWKKYLQFSVVVAVIASLWSMLDSFVLHAASLSVDVGRLNVPAGNALILGTYLAPYIFIAGFLVAQRAQFKLRLFEVYFNIFAAVIISVVVFLTYTRSSYVGIAAGVACAVAGFVFSERRRVGAKNTAKIFAAIISILVVFGGAFYIYTRSTDIAGGRIGFSDAAFATLKTRFINWGIAWRSIKQHPIVGVGWENYRAAADKLFDSSLAQYSYYETRIDKPHNVILEIWVTLGTVGLAAYLFFVYAAFYAAYRLRENKAITAASFWILVGFFVAYHVQNLFAFDTPQSLFTLGIVLAFLAANSEEKSIHLPEIVVPRKAFFVIYSVLSIGFFYFGAWSPLVSMYRINQGLLASQADDFDSLDYYARAAFAEKQGPYYFETWRWFAEALLKKYATDSTKLSLLTPDQRLRWNEDVTRVADLTARYGAAHKDSFEWQTFAGKVSYFLALATKENHYLLDAETYFLRAFEISKVRQEPPLLLGYVAALQGKNAEAVSWYGTALALSSSQEVAEELDWLINHFVKQGDSGSIILLLENSVKYNANATDYARLAAAYVSAKRFDDARAAVQKAVDLDPSFAAEAQAFISQFPKK